MSLADCGRVLTISDNFLLLCHHLPFRVASHPERLTLGKLTLGKPHDRIITQVRLTLGWVLTLRPSLLPGPDYTVWLGRDGDEDIRKLWMKLVMANLFRIPCVVL